MSEKYMPAFVKHEQDWAKARTSADKKGLKGESYWKYVTAIYRNMHPEDFSKQAYILHRVAVELSDIDKCHIYNKYKDKA